MPSLRILNVERTCLVVIECYLDLCIVKLSPAELRNLTQNTLLPLQVFEDEVIEYVFAGSRPYEDFDVSSLIFTDPPIGYSASEYPWACPVG